MKRRDVMRRMAAAALLPAGVGLAAGQQQQATSRPTRAGGAEQEAAGARPKVATAGELAPDFRLMPIKLYDFQAAEAEVNLQSAEGLFQPIVLSDFTGKKPVALIFGSYT